MSRILLAEFKGGEALVAAVHKAHNAGYRTIDAFAPFAVEGLAEALGAKRSHVRVAMFLGGVGIAALAYATEWWTAVINYPVNSGGRPLNAWPAFMLFPFAIGIFAAAVTGLITLFIESGLPRLHHKLFTIDGFERASQDAFLLAIDPPLSETDMEVAFDWLRKNDAVAIWEVKS